jgi:thioesterase domain-containing protein
MNAPSHRHALPATLFALGGTGTDGTIVFCPDYGGNVLYARPLVPLLAPGLQCLGLRLTPALLEAPGGIEIEALGRRFAADIHAAGLAAPLRLIGFSFAGIVAFETARQLAQQSAKVAQLWIVDTHIHRLFLHRHLLRGWPRELRQAAHWWRQNHRRMRNPVAEPNVLHRYRQMRFDLRDHPQAYRSVIRTLYEALARYRPQAWNGDATVLRARADGWPHIGDDLGWRHLIRGGLRTFALQTDHLGLLQSPDAVREVAKIILDPPHGSTEKDSA